MRMKRVVEDVVTPRRRLSQVLPASGRVGDRPPPPPPAFPERRGRRFGLWGLAVLGVILLAAAASLFLSGVTVTITPKSQDISVNGTWSASRAPGPGGLRYEVMKIEKFGSKSVPASGEEDVAVKASGSIVIFNDYSTASVRLIKDTRFETPDGLIYRIDRPVVVPGQRREGGKTVPGQIEAVVYADQPGERYNIGLSDFSIPGLKGSPQYAKMYARSKTPMAGGFVGKRLTVAPDLLERTRGEIETQLAAALRAQADLERPPGFVLFNGGIAYVYESVPGSEGGGQVEVKERGTLYGILFPEGELAGFLARQTVAAAVGDAPVRIHDPAALSFSPIPAGARFWEGDTISFTLAGTARIVWVVDEEKLAADLAGEDKGALTTVLSGYPAIEAASVVMRPFWRATYPEDPSDITVVSSDRAAD